jgi:hypothetical protein
MINVIIFKRSLNSIKYSSIILINIFVAINSREKLRFNFENKKSFSDSGSNSQSLR